MTLKIRKLLKRYNVTTLKELSQELKISLNRIKNISCGRTSFSSVFQKRGGFRVFLKHSEELAELIGIVLGDGNIFQFDRCQRLTISCNSSYRQYIRHVIHLVRSIFKKEPTILKKSKENCIDVRLYIQNIDKALELPVGNKLKNSVKIPEWIFEKKEYLRKCLKGLFETDGHYGLSRNFMLNIYNFVIEVNL